jgi:hypothetical protein
MPNLLAVGVELSFGFNPPYGNKGSRNRANRVMVWMETVVRIQTNATELSSMIHAK